MMHCRTVNSRTCFERSRRASWNDSRLDDIQSHQQLRTLTDSIPLMRIKALKVDIDINVGHENAKQLLLQAVKNNFSLRSVDGKERLQIGSERGYL